jgi:hypothetical protein
VIASYGIEKVIMTTNLKDNPNAEQWISRLKERDVDILLVP